jgi:hypothetical protein
MWIEWTILELLKTFKAYITGTGRTEMVNVFDDAAFIMGKFVVKFRSLKIYRPYPLVLLVNVGCRQRKALGSDSEMMHCDRNIILALKEAGSATRKYSF